MVANALTTPVLLVLDGPVPPGGQHGWVRAGEEYAGLESWSLPSNWHQLREHAFPGTRAGDFPGTKRPWL